MRQVRIAVGVAAAAVLAAGAIAWLARPAPVELDAALEKHRADADDRHARREQKVAEIQTAGTLDLLRVAGKAYRRHAELAKAPPTADDLRDAFAGLRSQRDGRPFVILWGVDLAALPGGGSGMLLAWEETADATGRRCVLMADGVTARVVSAEEFDRLPRAGPVTPSGP